MMSNIEKLKGICESIGLKVLSISHTGDGIIALHDGERYIDDFYVITAISESESIWAAEERAAAKCLALLDSPLGLAIKVVETGKVTKTPIATAVKNGGSTILVANATKPSISRTAAYRFAEIEARKLQLSLANPLPAAAPPPVCARNGQATDCGGRPAQNGKLCLLCRRRGRF